MRSTSRACHIATNSLFPPGRYFQCVSYGSLPTPQHELAYFLLNMSLMYAAPLLSTLYCSTAALQEIIRRANTTDGEPTRQHELAYFLLNMSLMYAAPLLSTLYCSTAALQEIIRRANTTDDKMRRSGVGILGRARARTLKMTVTIVIVFFTCWSPYYCYCLWYWVDQESVMRLDPAVQKCLWLFSCTNSCANPIVYGIFNRNRFFWRANPNNRFRSGSARRGSHLPYGESMEISAATLARARHSYSSQRHTASLDRQETTQPNQMNKKVWFGAKNGWHKTVNNNNNDSNDNV
ncbi:hypothetical protein JYU34_014133 [Plutella xylostella]|uniref:G-protein coupled receptors family 1 profile domain-containing protein n=1 Tax=Plutella xylostella TaxID=51655 RepID=A0ABQ7Q813_PLUXY|nr:hypothetical protein JYU34_014133 [Plutella xylostella]